MNSDGVRKQRRTLDSRSVLVTQCTGEGGAVALSTVRLTRNVILRVEGDRLILKRTACYSMQVTP
jgi:hypothetical protein